MTVCATADYLDTRSCYPVLDPRRTAGPGPYNYGYAFAKDGVQVTVARRPGPSSCVMGVVLASAPGLDKKGILAWNFHGRTFVDYVGNRGGDPTSMVIRKEGSPGQACGTGAGTVVLGRWDRDPVGWQAQYYFPLEDFWDFWGGCTVTFLWITDQRGSGLLGPQTPPPTYPLVRRPDYTLMKEDVMPVNGIPFTSLSIVVGGAAFPIREGEMGFSSTFPSIPAEPMPSTPADGTVVRHWDSQEVYVIYGGYPFPIPDSQTLYSLGIDWNRIRNIPHRGIVQLPGMPIDGTLLREQKGTTLFDDRATISDVVAGGGDPAVYLVDNQQLRHVTTTVALEENCLPWRHVRTVPENALANLEQGPDL
jgi:hypothetical protein